MSHYLLAIDQGTTSSRAIVFSAQGLPVASCQQEFKQYFPKDGWVEHDGEEIWLTTLQVCRDALARKGLRAADIAAIGITNQRETTLVWDAASGDLIHPAIVWQDRRTADYCAELKAAGHEANVSARTGLLIDPYFSATKLRWILDNVPGARQRAERGELRFGTVDCFLLWRLTGGRSHRTDATNASRTLLFNIHSQDWDEELLALFEIPRSLKWRMAEEEVQSSGITVTSAQGSPMKNPALTAANEAMRQMVTFGSLLGLDPSSRTRLIGGNKKPEANPFAELLR
ncbi:phage terminase small subunit P27 family [Pseudomonas aeruginosa]|uniref:phage terminase small subunit P27 family n=2 Tax=Pseudomonas aeruginosa TaxID=287 RepID=UPI0014046900|nr:phage terminase small subunit P27 family [Pseudomonas aeruginosa]